MKRTRRAPRVRAIGQEGRPSVPTLIVTNWKGGVWKTALAVAVADLLSRIGVDTLLLSTDPQLDAAKRLGLKPSGGVQCIPREDAALCVDAVPAGDIPSRVYAPRKPEYPEYQVIVVDAPPERRLSRLDGVSVVIPVDGPDAALNALYLLRQRSPRSYYLLVPILDVDVDMVAEVAARANKEWPGGKVEYYGETVPASPTVRRAHAERVSVWDMAPRRRAGTLVAFLDLAYEVAEVLWGQVRTDPMPVLPARGGGLYEPEGWSDE